MNSVELANLVIDTLDEYKALRITDCDVATLTDLMDRLIVCSSTSRHHANALADKVIRRAKANGIRPLGVEGEAEAEWILIDLYDVIVHIMLPEIREFYSLEKLWSVVENGSFKEYKN